MITVVNMIPNNWSDEQNQDAEPMLCVNPANPSQIIATAFTFDNPAGSSAVSPQMTGNWAPMYYSIDGGATWSLQFVLPSGSGALLPTFDVTTRFAGNTGNVYSGLISSVSSSILIGRAPDAVTQHQTMVTRSGDQPVVEATTALGGAGAGQDRVYVGYNGFTTHATSDQSTDAASAPPPAGFGAISLDVRSTTDGPKTRVAIHAGGTVYAAFYSLNATSTWDVVVVKDLNWGTSAPAYRALLDPGDGLAGKKVAAGITVGTSNSKDADFGHDRRGWELALAVDPNDDQRLYIVYSTGTGSADYTLHLRRSVNGGATWLPDSRTIVKAKNPGLAISMLGDVGFLYQQVVGPTGASNWVTVFEHSSDDFATAPDSHTLANVPSSVPVPAADMATYIGDYTRLQSVGKNFFGIFSANNTPNAANFPSGIVYQRNVNMVAGTLLGNDGVTPVPASIDPFFFSSTAIDPSADFYVRDWTDSPVSFDTGVEPSTHPVFYATSDVWNQRSNAAPAFNASDQPVSEDPQIAALGSNYAFTRISRRAAAPAGAADTQVTAEFLFADFGLGVPYADLPSGPATITFHAADSRLVTAGVPWTLPAAHSQHVCLAVQISTPADPFQNPTLLGRSPGWPTGSDVTVLNDNNKAQRNMGVYPVGQSAGGQAASINVYARLHNAATETRDMLVEYAGGGVRGDHAADVTVTLYGGRPVTLKAGDVLRVPHLLPGENRWLSVAVAADRPGSGAAFHDFREILGGKPLNGFRVVARPAKPDELIRWNLAAQRAVHARVQALFGDEPPAQIQRALDALDERRGEDVDAYVDFVHQHGWLASLVERLESAIDLTWFDPDAHRRRLSGAVRRDDTVAVANAHAALLHELDALVSMAQQARGDAADIVLNLDWQRALYARAPVAPDVVDEVRTKSLAFIQAYQHRRSGARDFPSFVRDLVPAFEKTVAGLGARGARLKPLVGMLVARDDDADAMQKHHRTFLLALAPFAG